MDRNEYLEIVAAQIRCKRAIPYLKEELEDHIQDQKDAYIAEGMNSFEAEMKAVKEMGDPVETGVQLDMVHRPKMEWRVLVGVFAMSLVGILIQMLILKGHAPDSSFFWYMHVMRRQLWGIAAGAFIMLAICYLDYTVLIKWSFQIWLILEVLIIYLSLCGVTINGRSYRAMHVAYFLFPFLICLFYKYRSEQWKGLIKSLGCLLVSVFTIFIIPDMASAVTLAASGMFVITITIHKQWYGIDRKKAYIGIWGGAAVLAGSLLVWITQRGAEYQIHRLKAWLSGEPGDFMIGHIREIVGIVKAGNAMDETLFETVRNDYLWTYLFEYLGTWKGISLMVLFFAFMTVIFMAVLKQKNRLGCVMGIGCIIYVSIQAALYMRSNFCIVPIAGNYMPFFSNGITPTVVTYFYMGILLSIFRNTNVVRN